MNTQTGYKLNQIHIFNAADIANTDFACYMDMSFKPVPMDFVYNKANLTLTLTPKNTTSFDDFKVIYFGNKTKDVNLCDPVTYTYTLKDSKEVDLSKSVATFALTNNAKVLPDLNVTLEMTTPNIVHVKWTYLNGTGKPTPFEVPKEIVNPVRASKGAALSNFVTLSLPGANFIMTVTGANDTRLIDFNGMAFDQYLNIMHAKLYTEKGDKFKGVMGLGQKTMSSLFYSDGVYSMWSLDTANPYESGKVPGANQYGTHPFYMFKRASGVWTGVYTNLAAA